MMILFVLTNLFIILQTLLYSIVIFDYKQVRKRLLSLEMKYDELDVRYDLLNNKCRVLNYKCEELKKKGKY